MAMVKAVMHEALSSYANPQEEIILIPRFYAFFTNHLLCTLKIQKATQPNNFKIFLSLKFTDLHRINNTGMQNQKVKIKIKVELNSLSGCHLTPYPTFYAIPTH